MTSGTDLLAVTEATRYSPVAIAMFAIGLIALVGLVWLALDAKTAARTVALLLRRRPSLGSK